MSDKSSWVQTTIGEACEVAPSGSSLEANSPFIPMASVEVGRMFPVSTEPRGTRGGIRAEANDLLFARITPCLENGKVALVPPNLDRVGGSTEFIVVRPSKAVLPKFLYYWSLHPEVRQLAQARMIGTTGRMRLSPTDLAAVPFRLTGTAEQSRVIAAIEEAFSKLDVGEAGLRKVRQQLERLRQAVRGAAVLGHLVPQAGSEIDAGEALVRAGKRVLQGDDLGELPTGWAWTEAANLSDGSRYGAAIGPFGSSLKVDDYRQAGVPLVFVRNIRRKSFEGDTKFVSPAKGEELSAHMVRFGDVLVTKMGSPPGDVAVYRSHVPAIITADCIKLTTGPLAAPEYLEIAIAAGKTRQKLLEITGGVAQQKVTLAGFKRLPIPVPPIEEQLRIVAETQRLFSFVEAAERAVETGLLRSAALRRSILKAAFEGRLVRQDPTDEPASVLLERIRAERLASAATAPKKTRSKVAK